MLTIILVAKQLNLKLPVVFLIKDNIQRNEMINFYFLIFTLFYRKTTLTCPLYL